MHLVKLPSGRYINLAAVAAVDPYPGNFVRVSFCAAGAGTVDTNTDVYLAERRYAGADATALLALLDGHAERCYAPGATTAGTGVGR